MRLIRGERASGKGKTSSKSPRQRGPYQNGPGMQADRKDECDTRVGVQAAKMVPIERPVWRATIEASTRVSNEEKKREEKKVPGTGSAHYRVDRTPE